MNWIRVQRKIASSATIQQLADECKVRRNEAQGAVISLLCALPDHARDGDISSVPPRQLEKWADWEGKPGAFAKAFTELMCTDGVVTNWEKYNGAAIRESDADRERKAEARKNAKRPPDSPPDKPRKSGGSLKNGTRDGTGRDKSSSIDDDRAGEPRASSSSDQSADREELERVLARIPDAGHRDAIRGYALRQPASKWLAIAGTLEALGPNGAQQVASTWHQLGQGAVDAILSSDSPSVHGNFLRACIRKAPTEPSTPKLELVQSDAPGTVRDAEGTLLWCPGWPPHARPSDDEIAANGWSVAA